MLGLIVLFQLVYGVHDLLFDMLDLLIHNGALIGRDILQLGEQLPHVDVQHLQLLLQFEHSERVLVECMGHSCEHTVKDQYTPGHKVI